jgi:hypothetical protein
MRPRLLLLIVLALSMMGAVDGSPDAWNDPDLTMQYSDTVDGCEWWASDFATGETLVNPVETPPGASMDQYLINIGQFIDSGLEVETHARCWIVDVRDGVSRIYSVEADTLTRNFLAPATAPNAPLLVP